MRMDLTTRKADLGLADRSSAAGAVSRSSSAAAAARMNVEKEMEPEVDVELRTEKDFYEVRVELPGNEAIGMSAAVGAMASGTARKKTL